MARLHVMERSHAQAVMDDLHDALGRRLAVSSLAPCPVEFTAALVNLCSTQSCGKCTPCRVGLSALSDLLADVLEGRADESTLNLIERTARTIYLSSDCAIGYEAGAMALTAIRGSVTILSITSASTPAALTARPASRASRAARRTSTFPVTSRSSRQAGMPTPSKSSARTTHCRSSAAWCASIPARCIAAAAWSTIP